MSQYSVVLSPGVTSTTVVLEDDTPLDDAIDELQHTFTLYQIFYGGVMGFTSTETFTFNGKTDCRELCYTFVRTFQTRSFFRFSLDQLAIV